MIEIDGSILEGGGQILRTSVAMSAITGTPVKISKIRAKRDNPGLQAQQMAAVSAVAKLVDAKVTGLQKGSYTVEFIPQKIRNGSFKVDVGTAGSISLIFQALSPVACFAPGEVALELTGGTDVPWSPSFDYLNLVFIPTLRKLGCKISAELIRRGHYPKGGGIVRFRFNPVTDRLKSISLDEFGEVENVKGVSHATRLPSHVATRQADSAKDALTRSGYGNIQIEISHKEDQLDYLSPGSGITLCASTTKGALVGADALGEKGKPAEKVGTEVAERLLAYLDKKCTVDSNLSDMLIPYMATAEGESTISTSELSLHAKTNITVTEKFLKTKFEVSEHNGLTSISCKGTGLGR
ncbi:MAG: RNA 3'-terminal phosphate cyclase [Candidatus Atabeyarchaeum deiterrae]